MIFGSSQKVLSAFVIVFQNVELISEKLSSGITLVIYCVSCTELILKYSGENKWIRIKAQNAPIPRNSHQAVILKVIMSSRNLLYYY